MNAASFDPVDADEELHDEFVQAAYMRGSHMGMWCGAVLGGIAVALLIQLGRWVGA